MEDLLKRIEGNKTVVFLGGSGCGKTTLMYEVAAALKKQNKNVALMEETARLCPLPINEDSTIDTQLWILGKQLTSQIEALYQRKNVDHFLFDRNVFDSLCFMQENDPYWVPVLMRALWMLMKNSYDLCVFINRAPQLDGDFGERSQNSEWQNKITKNIYDMLMMYFRDRTIFLEEDGTILTANEFKEKGILKF